jgi:CheY-like chemotaxis protein
VRVTRDGCEAIEIIREKQPDLIITDIFMPEKSGLEVIMEIRRNYPDIEIIAISGDSASRAGGHRDCLGLASSLGCSGILEKPFTNEQVLREVQKALSGQSSEES